MPEEKYFCEICGEEIELGGYWPREVMDRLKKNIREKPVCFKRECQKAYKSQKAANEIADKINEDEALLNLKAKVLNNRLEKQKN